MKEINHFMLPEHTNKLYSEEAISSISLTRDVADKINELVDAYNALSKIDLEWKQEQEGTIRKAVIYIKDNLINTLHDLVKILENEKFFDKTVEKYVVELENRVNNLLSSETADKEVIDIRLGENGKLYKTAGEAVRDQFKRLCSEVVNFCEYTNLKNKYEYNLFKVDYSKGEEVHFLSMGASCNIVGIGTDGSTNILVSHATEEQGICKVVLPKDITKIGVYMLEDGTAKVYIIGAFNRFLNKKIDESVKGEEIFTNTATEMNDNLLFRIVDNKVTRSTYDGGCCAKCRVEGLTQALISGFGWDSTYNYFLYAFADANNNLLELGTRDSKSVEALTLEVPNGAVNLFVNGKTDTTVADIKIVGTSNDFGELYNYYAEMHNVSNAPIKVMALGDSITKLGTSSNGWLRYFKERIKCNIVANVAVDGAVLKDYENTSYNGTPTNSNQTNNVLGNQVEKIIKGDYETPDVIIISVGTNGGIDINLEDIKGAYYDESNNLIALANVNRKTHAGAFRYATETLHEKYPDALILWCAPIMGYQSIRSAENAIAYSESLRVATEFIGYPYIDSNRCGINGVNEKNGTAGENLSDGLHTNATGARKLGYYIANKVKQLL